MESGCPFYLALKLAQFRPHKGEIGRRFAPADITFLFFFDNTVRPPPSYRRICGGVSAEGTGICFGAIK